MSHTQIPTHKDKIIIVEGNTDIRLFDHFFQMNNLDTSGIHIEPAGNVHRIGEVVQNIRIRFPNYKTFLIIVDRDSHLPQLPNHFQVICQALAQVSLPQPSGEGVLSVSVNGFQTGIYVMPGSESGHMIEDLLFKTIHEDQQTLINIFFDQFDALSELCKNHFQYDPITQRPLRNPSKAKLNVYRATFCDIKNPDFENHWDLTNTVFDDFKTFLQPILAQL